MDARDTLGMIAAIGAVVFMAIVAKAEAPRVAESETGIVVEYHGSSEPAAADPAPTAPGLRKAGPKRLTPFAAEVDRLRAEIADAKRLAAQGGPDAVAFEELAARKQRQLETLNAEAQALNTAQGEQDGGAGQGSPGDQQTAKARQNYQNSRQEMKQQIPTLKMQRMMDPGQAQ